MYTKLFLFLVLAAPALGAEFNITNYGAVKDDGIPDTGAFRQAVAAAELACGGTVVIPRGEFLLTDMVYTSFSMSNCGFVHLAFRGETGAEVRVITGSTNTAFLMTSLLSLKVSNITFLGAEVPFTDPTFTGAKNVFYVNGVETSLFENVYFYNLGVTEAIIRVGVTKIRIEGCQFNGNAAYYSSNLETGGAYILGQNDGNGNAWLNITVNRSTFTDYVNYKTRWLSKTVAMTGAYIRTVQANTFGHAQGTGRLIVTDCMFDEGAHTAVMATNTPYVQLSGVSVNLNSTTNSTAVRLTNVKHAIISQGVADWSQNGRPFITTQNVNFVKLSGLELRAGNTFWHNLGNTNMVIEYCEECASKPYVPSK